MSLAKSTYRLAATTPGCVLLPFRCTGNTTNDPVKDAKLKGFSVSRLAQGKIRVTITGSGSLIALVPLSCEVLDPDDAAHELYASFQEVSAASRYVDIYVTDLTAAPALVDLATDEVLSGCLLVVDRSA